MQGSGAAVGVAVRILAAAAVVLLTVVGSDRAPDGGGTEAPRGERPAAASTAPARDTPDGPPHAASSSVRSAEALQQAPVVPLSPPPAPPPATSAEEPAPAVAGAVASPGCAVLPVIISPESALLEAARAAAALWNTYLGCERLSVGPGGMVVAFAHDWPGECLKPDVVACTATAVWIEPSAGPSYDLASVIAHELGHVLNYGHGSGIPIMDPGNWAGPGTVWCSLFERCR